MLPELLHKLGPNKKLEMLFSGACSTHLSGVLGLPRLVHRRREDLTSISSTVSRCQKGSLPGTNRSMVDQSCTQQEAHSGILHLEKALLILQVVEIGICPVQRDTPSSCKTSLHFSCSWRLGA